MRNLKKFFPIIVTLTVFIIFYYSIDTNQLIKIFKSFSVKALFLAVVLYGLSYVARAIRFKILLKDEELSFSKILPIVYIHGFYNRVLPARTGELTFIYLMNKNQVETEKSILALIYARMYDLLTMLFLVLITLPAILNKFTNLTSTMVPSIVLLTISLLLIMVYFTKVLLFLHNLLSKKQARPNSFLAKIKNSIYKTLEYSNVGNDKVQVFKIIVISIINWLLIFSMFYVLMLEFNIKLEFLRVLFGSSFANLTNVLPISAIGGFGTMEVGWTLGFTMIGLNYKTAVTTGVAVNMFAFITISVFGATGLLINKLKFKESHRIHNNRGGVK